MFASFFHVASSSDALHATRHRGGVTRWDLVVVVDLLVARAGARRSRCDAARCAVAYVRVDVFM